MARIGCIHTGERQVFSGSRPAIEDSRSEQLTTSLFKVSRLGLEPRTPALKGQCSTIELPARTRTFPSYTIFRGSVNCKFAAAGAAALDAHAGVSLTNFSRTAYYLLLLL
jgi:hypothetical protein